MLPIRDTIRSRSFPLVNWLIIILNGLIFYHQSTLSQAQLESFAQMWALVPAKINLAQPAHLVPLFDAHVAARLADASDQQHVDPDHFRR